MKKPILNSLWLEQHGTPSASPLAKDISCDVCIIGAGIAGLTSAYLLLKEGLSVVVIDKGPIAGGESPRTTAHLVSALDDRYYKLIRYRGIENAKLAAESHTKAIQKIREIVETEDLDCDFQLVNGYLFANDERPISELDDEFDAIKKMGMPDVMMVLPMPITSFTTEKCLCFKDQAKIHPTKYFTGLAHVIKQMGGHLFSETSAQKIQGGKNAFVRTDKEHDIRCKHIIVATNTPVNDLVTIHLEQASYTTYVMTCRLKKGIMEDALYWDTGNPYHYLRIDPDENADTILLTAGGEDHRTGQEPHPQKRLDALEKWVREKFPIEEILYHWSGQVMEPYDGLAFIGRSPHEKNVYIITGDSGNGMTHGTLGAILLTDLILGLPNPWEKLYDPCRIIIPAMPKLIAEDANTLLQYGAWLTPGDKESPLTPHKGKVVRHGLRKVAVGKDDHSRVHTLNAACSHLGCIVEWNEFEMSWDCPCHGSRFDVKGNVVHGPAKTPLRRVEEEP